MIIYIAGPMTGLKGFNRDSFNLAEIALREQGHEVRNPACLPTDWSEYQHYIEVGMAMLGQCDSIVFLPGSEKSPGAQRELQRSVELGIVSYCGLHDVWPALQVAYTANKGAS